jgi:8-oxo-dGTP pyrophosphatase MutT (NUDIX family)
VESKAHPPHITETELALRLRSILGRREPHRLEVSSASPSAVLVPLFVADGAIHVLFTKRSETLPHHQGQIAFPGGRHDAHVDGSMRATATREAHEEIGLDPQHVDVLGALDEIHTFRTNFVISPFVALIPHPYSFQLNAMEVAEVFSMSLTELRDPAGHREELWEFERMRVPITSIRYREHVIWGATERISRNLMAVLEMIEDGAATPAQRPIGT